MSLNTVDDSVNAVANVANSTTTINNNSLTPARAPPSPPDSPKSHSNSHSASCTSPRAGFSRPSSSASSTSASIQSLHIASVPPSAFLHQHTLATSSPGLDAAISTNLPSSPSVRSTSSYRSASVSPNPAAALHRATRRDQDANDIASDSDVTEAQGLMHSLGLGSPVGSPPPGVKCTQGRCRCFFTNYDY